MQIILKYLIKCKELILLYGAIKKYVSANEIVFRKVKREYETFSLSSSEYSILGNSENLSLIFCCSTRLEYLHNSEYRIGDIYFFIREKVHFTVPSFFKEVNSYEFRLTDNYSIEDVSFICPKFLTLLIKNIDIVKTEDLRLFGYPALFKVSKEDFYNYLLPHMKIYK